MSRNRRRLERFSLNLQARISSSHSEDSPADYYETVAANISSGGAFLQTAHPFAMASKVLVEFLVSYDDLKKLKFILSVETLRKLTGSQIWVKATGVVIRQEEGGVAVIFDKNYQLTPMAPADK